MSADGAALADPASFGITQTRPQVSGARGAVIIPAHDEEKVIGRTLGALAALAAEPSIEVVVVCNGCSDDTARVARSFPWVRVEEIAEASKTAALNVGDRLATQWPRLYLDADIELAPAAVLGTLAAVSGPGVRAGRPRHAYDISASSALVRGYYRARSRIPGPVRLWGAGGYATNEAGHRRFGAFPAVTADDSWFDAQFADHEKHIVDTPPMRIRTPRNAADLLRVLTRQRRGYVELEIPAETGSRGRALLATVRGPRSAWDTLTYVAFTVVSRALSERALRQAGARAWERDGSTRTSTEAREATT
ncbi:glycosyl transferase, family 2 [Xylanimonas cellulosilytica DSM 15894]|uniref:4,4'-diaponeurosporenoate glycosyltransferase n=1 Tax=Xylanimonas cellulosilytica (strain DSM 15894 / JCM 12276 / CECT 5975 / KCTC 9989 / LMG 20990 / NBRC 107835 / XIL07) TaxID=446471 RepID=D1BXR4_XYLCX|nr:glycosyltransferase [Xylanimonas cellulosilytica]ACZ31705.1 glycosyl transferase, family 2 [Xylanimonas cellulosilytica DSM 15894]